MEGEPACMVMQGTDKVYPDEAFVKVPVKRGSMVLLKNKKVNSYSYVGPLVGGQS